MCGSGNSGSVLLLGEAIGGVPGVYKLEDTGDITGNDDSGAVAAHDRHI